MNILLLGFLALATVASYVAGSVSLPSCPQSVQPLGICNNGMCPTGYTCSAGNVCCKKPAPTCPAGQQTATCVNNMCPPGWSTCQAGNICCKK